MDAWNNRMMMVIEEEEQVGEITGAMTHKTW